MTELEMIRANIHSTYSALAAHAMESRVLNRYDPQTQGRIATAMRYLDSAREVLENLEKADQTTERGKNFPP